jgi:DNA-binding XRE family transcriptional regulator
MTAITAGKFRKKKSGKGAQMNNPLKKIRIHFGLNGEQMARLMGMSTGAYYRREADPMSTRCVELSGLIDCGIEALCFFYPHLPVSKDMAAACFKISNALGCRYDG